MSIEKVKNTKYQLQTWEGDSGSIIINGLDGERGSKLYMEIHGSQKVLKTVELTGQPSVTIHIDVADTDALGVGSWDYGIKICKEVSEGVFEENTYIPRLGDCGCNQALFIVNPKRVEGE